MNILFKKLLFLCCAFLYASFVFAAKDEKSVEVSAPTAVIIKNELSNEAEGQGVSAPALVPSNASKLRDARQKQEIQTEDRLIKELEKQRLLEEQKRLDQLLGNTKDSPPQPKTAQAETKQWVFGSKSFVALGAGAVTYPGSTNINSINLDIPAVFLSFGGYDHKGFLIFDVSFNYSQHYLNPHKPVPNPSYPLDTRLVYYQPSAAMSVKISPLKGRMKPYVGISGALVFSSEDTVDKYGTPVNVIQTYMNQNIDKPENRSWDQSYDAGFALGADLALGKHLGLNVDLRYHWNLWAEQSAKDDPIHTAYWNIVHSHFYHNQQKDKIADRNSLIISANLRYYF